MLAIIFLLLLDPEGEVSQVAEHYWWSPEVKGFIKRSTRSPKKCSVVQLHQKANSKVVKN